MRTVSTKGVENLAAPQGFEPRYADPESAVLPLNEGAAAVFTIADVVYRVKLAANDACGGRHTITS
jgi:hypothetical protein